MEDNIVKIKHYSKYLIVEAPKMNKKEDFEIWLKMKNIIAKEVVRNRKVYAVAISPADEPEFFVNSGIPCEKCPPPLTDCYLITPESWPEDILEDMVSSMSFELSQLWLYKPPADVAKLIDTALKCCGPGDVPETEFEVFGCIADDKEVIWTNYGNETNVEVVKKSLEDVIKHNNFQWRVEITSEIPCSLPNLQLPLVAT